VKATFIVIGAPEGVDFKRTSNDKEFAIFRIGCIRFTTFSESGLAVLKLNPAEILVTGQIREREWEGKKFPEFSADTVLLTKAALGVLHNDPKAGADLPF
jgi:hypothetical protein